MCVHLHKTSQDYLELKTFNLAKKRNTFCHLQTIENIVAVILTNKFVIVKARSISNDVSVCTKTNTWSQVGAFNVLQPFDAPKFGGRGAIIPIDSTNAFVNVIALGLSSVQDSKPHVIGSNQIWKRNTKFEFAQVNCCRSIRTLLVFHCIKVKIRAECGQSCSFILTDGFGLNKSAE